MNAARKPARATTAVIIAIGVLMFGSLAVTGGYAWFLRSGRYRLACAQALTEAIGLPSEIGRVVPRSRTSREFRDVVVWLPGRRGRALSCRRAVVTDVPTPDEPEQYDITLNGGACEISTRTWLRSDYRGVFASGLRSGFSPDGPRRVTFGSMDVGFERNGFQARFHEAGGYVDFEDPQRGYVSIVCNKLNDYAAPHPVHLTAEIVPDEDGVRIDRLELNVPDVPLEALHLGELTGAAMCSGAFSGNLTYSEQPGGNSLTLAGTCMGLALPDLTGSLSPGPWRGRCPRIDVQELRVEGGHPTYLRFAGRVEDIEARDILATFGLPPVSGTVTFDVGTAEIERDHIVRFVASGQVLGVPVEDLTAAIGKGSISGTLHVRINDLTIENDHLKSFDAVAEIEPAADGSNWIESTLLTDVAGRLLGFDMPSIPPQRVEFSNLGVRLEVRDERLYVYGTHGPRDRTIVSVRLLGFDVPIREPKNSFDLQGYFDALRERLHGVVRGHSHR